MVRQNATVQHFGAPLQQPSTRAYTCANQIVLQTHCAERLASSAPCAAAAVAQHPGAYLEHNICQGHIADGWTCKPTCLQRENGSADCPREPLGRFPDCGMIAAARIPRSRTRSGNSISTRIFTTLIDVLCHTSMRPMRVTPGGSGIRGDSGSASASAPPPSLRLPPALSRPPSPAWLPLFLPPLRCPELLCLESWPSPLQPHSRSPA